MNNSESLRHFLNRECPRWDLRNNIPLVNDRLASFGNLSVSFLHRPQRDPILGRIVIERFNAMDAYFWYRRCKKWMSIEDYFLVHYGYDVRYPKGYVCRLLPAEYKEADCEVGSDNLFPLEVLLINH
ncbi:hypothetical protein GCK72_026221 [Caenorhabditis remanei]|uniref:PAZ domain-containing protein n=1 Tax=Caenorhabditis remanei TaxID=31234 RepID=A0A6A5G4X1_CAERE|nr:hypothetical protein GCK72_026221 [Caenorhabditis remanei]KAF1749752.1 hypothetical protein GCK72_026221 [Caenorhabditis remanei]